VFYQNITFPLKNLPVVSHTQRLRQLDGPGVLALPGLENGNYEKIRALAVQLADSWPDQPVLIALQADMAKALGHALALRLGRTASILCLDRVYLEEGSYLDVGAPVACALPVVIKTLILNG
jgi:ethanolamine utilization protein EutA